MHNRFKHTLLAALAGGLAFAAGCDGNHPGLIYAQPSELQGTLTFDQNLESQDENDSVAFPGQANNWDITNDFAISDGADDQFDGVLFVSVGEESFPEDQVYSELTWFGPDFTSEDGLVAAAVADGDYEEYLYNGYAAEVIDGDYSAYLKGTAESLLQQTVDLSGADGSVEFTWDDYIYSCPWDFDDEDDIEDVEPYEYRVVIRDESGNELEELFSHTEVEDDTDDSHFADLTDYSGDTIVISFERMNGNGSWSGFCTTAIDEVSIVDDGGSGDEYVENGDFEDGDLTGWTQSAISPQNVRSGSRTVGGLLVTRSFFANPSNQWGRMTDEFVNMGDEPVETVITYYSELGSDDYGILYLTPGSGDRAITGWDGDSEDDPDDSGSDRDLAFIFGSGATDVLFTSDTAMDEGDGSDEIYYSFPVTVEPGQTITIVNFLVLNGIDTGNEPGTTVSSTATAMDDEVNRILSGIDNGPFAEFAEGMTRQQLETVINFSLRPY